MILPFIIGLAISLAGLAAGYALRGTWLGAVSAFFTCAFPSAIGLFASILAHDESRGVAAVIIVAAFVSTVLSGGAGWHYAEADRCRRARVAMGAGR